MLKKLYPAILVLVILVAAVGGYYFRPWMDLNLVDYPLVQDAALYGVEMYEYVAERLADYSDYQESIELVALEYDGIMTKIEDARLRESMKGDWRYLVVDELESTAPMVWVINLEVEEDVATLQLYFQDGETLPPFSSAEVFEARLEITALAVQLVAEHCPDHIVDVQWVAVEPYECLGDRCVIGALALGIKAPADVFLEWANSQNLLENVAILEAGGAEVFIHNMWGRWIFVEEELPRLSDDLAPWDQEWFYED